MPAVTVSAEAERIISRRKKNGKNRDNPFMPCRHGDGGKRGRERKKGEIGKITSRPTPPSSGRKKNSKIDV